MTDEQKKARAIQFLSRYKEQNARVEWQKQKIEGLRKIITDDENDEGSDEITPAEDIKAAIGWDAEKEKLKAEKAKACSLYREIMDALDKLPAADEREILFRIYLEDMTQDGVACRELVHPKTIARKHRRGLIRLYDNMHL